MGNDREAKRSKLLEFLDRAAPVVALGAFGLFILAPVFLDKGRPDSYSEELRKMKQIRTGGYYPRLIVLDEKGRMVVINHRPMDNILIGLAVPGLFFMLFAARAMQFFVESKQGGKPWLKMKKVLGLVLLGGAAIFFLEKMTYTKTTVLDGRARKVEIKTGRIAGLGEPETWSIPYAKVRGLFLVTDDRYYDLEIRIRFRGEPPAHPSLGIFSMRQGPKNWIRRKRDIASMRNRIARTAGL